MKIFSLCSPFFVIFLLFTISLHSNEFFLLNKCKISLKIGNHFKVLEQTENSLLLQQNHDIYIILCTLNKERIFQHKENTETINIHLLDTNLNEYHFKGYIESKKIYGRKAYNTCITVFYTTENIYKILNFNEMNQKQHYQIDDCKSKISSILDKIFFVEKVKIPISEKEYKIRFSIFVIALMFSLLLFIYILVSKFFKKKIKN